MFSVVWISRGNSLTCRYAGCVLSFSQHLTAIPWTSINRMINSTYSNNYPPILQRVYTAYHPPIHKYPITTPRPHSPNDTPTEQSPPPQSPSTPSPASYLPTPHTTTTPPSSSPPTHSPHTTALMQTTPPHNPNPPHASSTKIRVQTPGHEPQDDSAPEAKVGFPQRAYVP